MALRFSPRLIRNRRQELQLTQDQVSRAIGVTQGTYWKYENGMTTPNIELLPMFVNALRCDVWDLFEGVRE